MEPRETEKRTGLVLASMPSQEATAPAASSARGPGGARKTNGTVVGGLQVRVEDGERQLRQIAAPGQGVAADFNR